MNTFTNGGVGGGGVGGDFLLVLNKLELLVSIQLSFYFVQSNETRLLSEELRTTFYEEDLVLYKAAHLLGALLRLSLTIDCFHSSYQDHFASS